MKDRICFVTGATSGIGRATALALATTGVRIVMAVRDAGRGDAAVRELKSQNGNAEVDMLLGDLSSLASVRKMAELFKAKYSRLDLLINNAAVYKNARTVTADGFETMFATNHLGPFLLTNLLLEPLAASGSARVLNLSAPSTVKLNFDDLQGRKRFNALNTFGASKMCNLLFTFELARQLTERGTGVIVNAVHPGIVRSTNLMREAPIPLRWVPRFFGAAPERAAEPIVRLATAPEFTGQTGKFFHNAKEIKADAYSHDRDTQQRLWQISAKLANLPV